VHDLADVTGRDVLGVIAVTIEVDSVYVTYFTVSIVAVAVHTARREASNDSTSIVGIRTYPLALQSSVEHTRTVVEVVRCGDKVIAVRAGIVVEDAQQTVRDGARNHESRGSVVAVLLRSCHLFDASDSSIDHHLTLTCSAGRLGGASPVLIETVSAARSETGDVTVGIERITSWWREGSRDVDRFVGLMDEQALANIGSSHIKTIT